MKGVNLASTKNDEGYVELDNVNKDKKEEKKEPKAKKEPKNKPEEKPKEEVKEKKVIKRLKKLKIRVKDHVETDIDKLYEIVRDKGTLNVKEASKKLKLDVDRVEEWGRILEDHNLIKLHYPPIGEPVMILKKFKVDTKEIKKLDVIKKII